LKGLSTSPLPKATTKQWLDPLCGPSKNPAYPPTGRPRRHQTPGIVFSSKRHCAGGLPIPKMSIVTFSLHLRTHLLTTGRYITAFANSVLRLNEKRFSLRALPVEMPTRPWPIAIITLRNRTLSAVGVFIESVRACMR
jgi:DNA-binding transcriptional LysR family regulator